MGQERVGSRSWTWTWTRYVVYMCEIVKNPQIGAGLKRKEKEQNN